VARHDWHAAYNHAYYQGLEDDPEAHSKDVDGTRVLFDCGFFQGLKQLRLRNWDDFPVAPSSINAVVLIHAHLDHVGYLPLLVAHGFKGRAFCTSAQPTSAP
jgi:metallo-beta-lactamase family protein